MLTFEITKTNTPLPQKGLAPILIAPPHTYVRQRLVLWNKPKPMLLAYREETNQPRRPIAGLPAPWVLSSAGKLIRYLHGSYFLPYRNTVSTPDASGVVRQNTIEFIIISDAVYTGCSAVPRHNKSPTVNCCRVLFMTYWHKFQMIFNGRFVMSSVDRPLLHPVKTWCKPSFVPQMFSSFVFYSLSFCRRSARLTSVMCTDERSLLCVMSRHAPYCWLATSLLWYWPNSVF